MPVVVRTFSADPKTFINYADQTAEEIADAIESLAIKTMERLKKYPPYKYVPWKGRYHSKKQENYVHWMMSKGAWGISPPYYKRTQEMKQSWKFSKEENSRKKTFTVESVGAHGGRGRYIQGPKSQHWRMREIGWIDIELAEFWTYIHRGGVLAGMKSRVRKF